MTEGINAWAKMQKTISPVLAAVMSPNPTVVKIVLLLSACVFVCERVRVCVCIRVCVCVCVCVCVSE